MVLFFFSEKFNARLHSYHVPDQTLSESSSHTKKYFLFFLKERSTNLLTSKNTERKNKSKFIQEELDREHYSSDELLDHQSTSTPTTTGEEEPIPPAAWEREDLQH